jgi:hypothetical protein
MLGECTGLLNDIVLHTNISDSWLWRHDTDGGYSVKGAYALLTRVDVVNEAATSDLIWHKLVPLKVSVMAWRLFRNRLPTKDNLMTRNIISHEASFCVNGCGTLETANHLFLPCPDFAPLWSMIRSWIGVASADPQLLHDHFAQFVACSGGSQTRCSFLQLVWLCCISVIWHERNNRVFKATGTTIQQMFEKVKLSMFWWLKANNVTLGINNHMWWSSLFVCLSID